MLSKVIITDYYTLCKPKVVFLMLITTWVGMHLAAQGFVPWQVLIWATIGIALAASSAAVINHLVDRKIDAQMSRTAYRPIAQGRISAKQAIVFSILLGCLGLFILVIAVNHITAILSFLTLFGYAIFYTIFLKRATPQNIVIGGLAGAMPPLLGWSAVTGEITPESWLLVLIIFTWTPPHFWALAIYRVHEYAKVNIPMLPVTHGIKFTKTFIVLYTMLLFPVTALPYLVGMSGKLYLFGAIILTGMFLKYCIDLYKSKLDSTALKTFNFSIFYLGLLFFLLLIDHYIMIYSKAVT